MKNKNKFFKLIAKILLAIIISSSVLGIFTSPKKASAIHTVPTFVTGGRLEGIGNVTSLSVDRSATAKEILQAAAAAGMSEALKNYGVRISEDFQRQLGRDAYGDTESAVQANHLPKALYQAFPRADETPAIPSDPNRQVPNDTLSIATDFMGLPLARNGPNYAARIGQEQFNYAFGQAAGALVSEQEKRLRRIQFQRQFQNIMVGAITQFTSPIACGGLDPNALRNAGIYLAQASTGVVASAIDSSLGLDYYSQMARLGAPTANPNYWSYVLHDNAMSLEAKARQAAAIEATSPGLKTPYQVSRVVGRDFETGQPKVQYRLEASRTLDALRAVNSQNYGSIYQGTLNLAKSAAVDFVTYDAVIGMLYATDALSKLLSELISSITGGHGILNKVFGYIKDIAKWKLPILRVFAGRVAYFIVQKYARTLTDTIIRSIFRGKVLAASYGCRQPARLTDFRTTVDTSKPLDVTIPGIDVPSSTNPDSTIIFSITPELLVTPDDLANGVFLEWDASLAELNLAEGETLRVDLSGGKYGAGQTVDPLGNDIDSPRVTTSYTLTVYSVAATGQRQLGSETRTVTVNLASEGGGGQSGQLDVSQATFDVQVDGASVRSVPVGTLVDIIWDASSIAGVTETLVYANGDVMGGGTTTVSGTVPNFRVDGDTQFVLVVKVGEQQGSKTITVTATSGTTAGAFTSSNFQIRE